MEADISALQDKLTEVRGGWGGGGVGQGYRAGKYYSAHVKNHSLMFFTQKNKSALSSAETYVLLCSKKGFF